MTLRGRKLAYEKARKKYEYWRDVRRSSLRRRVMLPLRRTQMRDARTEWRKAEQRSKPSAGGFGVDYSESRPSFDAMRKAGVGFVCRYLSNVDPRSPTATKTLSVKEATRLRRAGFPIVLVFESSAARATQGYRAGIADAVTAQRHMDILGAPASVVPYFAVDSDVSGPEVEAYFRGVVSVFGRVGAYGSYRVIEYLFDQKLITHGWQTYAWSGGKVSPRAKLYQYSNDRTIGGASVDFNRASGPIGAWS